MDVNESTNCFVEQMAVVSVLRVDVWFEGRSPHLLTTRHEAHELFLEKTQRKIMCFNLIASR